MIKKHFKQMTHQEVYIIQKRISLLKRYSLSKYQFSKHASIRMNQRHIKGRELFEIFNSYQIVEFRVVKDDIRVVIRSNYITHLNNNTLISISLLNGKLITCYEVNKNKLKHVNMNKYNPNLEINQLFQEYIHKIA